MKLKGILILFFLAYAFAEDVTDEGYVDEDSNESAFDRAVRVNNKSISTYNWISEPPELLEEDIVQTPELKKTIEKLLLGDYVVGDTPYDALVNRRWTGKTVPYTFARGFSYTRVVENAIGQFNQHTCIKWVRRSSERNYVQFVHKGGCYSMIGMQGGKQEISLGSGCGTVGVAVHEMMHALGFFHEQSRRDRDRYITVNFGNIRRGMEYNFRMYRPGEATTHGEPYDKQSVMHYGNYAFSANGRKTIVSRSNSNERLGQRNGFSSIDKKQLNKHYKCTDTGSTDGPVTECGDKYPFCNLLGKWCNTYDIVSTNCKKECDRCPKPTPPTLCRDSNRYCLQWRDLGYCNNRYEDYMQKNCKKSCNVC